MFGDPEHKSPEMMHKWAYTFNAMQVLLESLGYREVNGRKRPETHIAVRDMRFEARK
jgi:hypothetical protein